MRRRAPEQAIGLAALDVVCGLFGMLVTLYALTSPADGARGVADVTPQFVQLQIGGHDPVRAGLEIVVGGKAFRSWPDCIGAGVVRWTRCDTSLLEAMVWSAEPIERMHLVLLDIASVDEVQAWIKAPGLSATCTLALEQGYRARGDDPACASTRAR